MFVMALPIPNYMVLGAWCSILVLSWTSFSNAIVLVVAFESSPLDLEAQALIESE